jgi:hypothetical protein
MSQQPSTASTGASLVASGLVRATVASLLLLIVVGVVLTAFAGSFSDV